MFNDRQLKLNCPIMSSSCRNFQLSLSFSRPLPTSITARNRCGQSNYSYFPFYIVRNPNILVTTDWLNRIQSQKRKSARKGSFSVSSSKYTLGKGDDELDPTCKRVKGYRKYFNRGMYPLILNQISHQEFDLGRVLVWNALKALSM